MLIGREVEKQELDRKANKPTFPGQEHFAAEQQHSSEHRGPDA